MIDDTVLESLGNSWLSALKRECAEQFPDEGDKAFCIVLAAAWWFLLANYDQEFLIEQLSMPLASAGYKAVKAS
jgi:hypothetical protein